MAGMKTDKKVLSKEREEYFWKEIRKINQSSRTNMSRKFIQHGNTSVYAHSLAVAYECCLFAERHHLDVDYASLIRGAFLHDYFLYDWHDKNHIHKRPHGFYHPQAALDNARQDFLLNEREENMIKRHMFPLTLVPPRYKEAWILCYIDKVCSGRETVKRS